MHPLLPSPRTPCNRMYLESHRRLLGERRKRSCPLRGCRRISCIPIHGEGVNKERLSIAVSKIKTTISARFFSKWFPLQTPTTFLQRPDREPACVGSMCHCLQVLLGTLHTGFARTITHASQTMCIQISVTHTAATTGTTRRVFSDLPSGHSGTTLRNFYKSGPLLLCPHVLTMVRFYPLGRRALIFSDIFSRRVSRFSVLAVPNIRLATPVTFG